MEAGDCPPLNINAMWVISVKSYLKQARIWIQPSKLYKTFLHVLSGIASLFIVQLKLGLRYDIYKSIIEKHTVLKKVSILRWFKNGNIGNFTLWSSWICVHSGTWNFSTMLTKNQLTAVYLFSLQTVYLNMSFWYQHNKREQGFILFGTIAWLL